MKKLALAGAMALVSSLAVAQDMAPNGDMPPVQYRGASFGVVVYTNEIARYCGTSPDPTLTIVACYFPDQKITFLPNPCNLGDREIYAKIACHEAGHRNGWRH